MSRSDEIEELFPVDGPHSRESVIEAARGLSHLVRYLNHATQNRKAMEWGSTTYSVLGNLNSVTYGLNQLLDQLGEALHEYGQDPTAYDDRRDRPAAETASQVRALLMEARTHFALVRHRIEKAHGEASHLGND